MGEQELKLFLLGPPRLESGDGVLKLPRRKGLALLAYLAVTGRAHGRDTLATLFWPESSQSAARTNLRTTLASLKKALGEGWLDLGRESISLSRRPALFIDVVRFRHLLSEIQVHDHGPDAACPTCLPLLKEATELYRGDFLAGFTLRDCPAFDDWQFFETGGLRSDLLSSLERLTEAYKSQQEFDPAIRYARRWLDLDPLQEEGHRQLMELYFVSGQKVVALKQYEECVRILEEELGATPERKTTELYERIQEGALPAPRRVAYLRTNLPAEVTLFVGREDLLAELHNKLCSAETRLLTLTGPGGTGKTRLALRAASEMLDEFEDGVFFVDLAAINDPALVVQEIADALGLSDDTGRSIDDHLVDYLQNKQLLLVLDNFEQIVEAAPVVSRLLSEAPLLKVLVTSRTPLQVYGESIVSVPPLTAPSGEDPGDLQRLNYYEYEAVQLFDDRAQLVKSDFVLNEINGTAVAEICRQLDGLPLAIELAAARVRILAPQTIVGQLGSRRYTLAAKARDLPPRHQTLHSTIEWSYNLLDEGQKELFRRLALFSGGCSLQAAAFVCLDNGRTAEAQEVSLPQTDGTQLSDKEYTLLAVLESLVDQSVLKLVEREDLPRFTMLQTIREYASEIVRQSGEKDQISYRHLVYFLALAREAERRLRGSQQAKWSELLALEQDNFRSALAWSFDQDGEVAELGLELVAFLGMYWHVAGLWQEGRNWLEKAVFRQDQATTQVRAKLLYHLAGMQSRHREFDQVPGLLQESLNLFRSVDDKVGMAHTLLAMGRVDLRVTRDIQRAISFLEQSLILFEEVGDKTGVSQTLLRLGQVANYQGERERARKLLAQSLALAREINDAMTIANISLEYVEVSLREGADVEECVELLETSLVSMQQVNSRGYIIRINTYLGELARLQGDYDKAFLLYQEALTLAHKVGGGWFIPPLLVNLGHVALYLESTREAKNLFLESFSLSIQRSFGATVAGSLAGLAKVAGAEGQLELAARLFGAAESIIEAEGIYVNAIDQADWDSSVAALRSQLDEATFAKEWMAGRAMTAEQAIAAYKELSDLGSPSPQKSNEPKI